VGKLFFRDQAGNAYICLGSMIKPGVALTTEHCVHSSNGSASGWYNSFTFVPGYSRVGTTETRHQVGSDVQVTKPASAKHSEHPCRALVRHACAGVPAPRHSSTQPST
jgi:V8-like Glu-specific endopeptidase